jgi:hypothetical protein
MALADPELAAAHEHFSKTCFNRAWDYIEKPDRSAEDDEEMIRLNQASLWHWTQRPDCTDRNRAIGYWQASRIRALVGHGEEALRYARLTLGYSGSLAAFHRAMAHEALARAAQVLGDRASVREHVERARELAESVDDAEERSIIDADLATLD